VKKIANPKRVFVMIQTSSSHRSLSLRATLSLGFTLVELLVVIAIIGVLTGLAVPAMQNMREISRRSNCQYNLSELSLALSAYQTQQSHFPIGTIANEGPIRNIAEGYHHNWIEALLPMMDLDPIHQAIDTEVSVYHANNDRVRSVRIARLLCPSATAIRDNTTCYAAIHASNETAIDQDNDGVFFLNRSVTPDEITDGLSYTLFIGEKVSRFEHDLGWISGTNSSLRNAGHRINEERLSVRGPIDEDAIIPPTYVGGIISDHPSGAHLLMGSGEIKFASESMDTEVLRQMASRSDGELPLEWQSNQPL
jgi:prepilin-type N-terminal cleavage/methylation domain-containing protein